MRKNRYQKQVLRMVRSFRPKPVRSGGSPRLDLPQWSDSAEVPAGLATMLEAKQSRAIYGVLGQEIIPDCCAGRRLCAGAG